MPLTNEEAIAAYATLRRAATDAGLAWVLVQVEERLAIGKVSLKRVSAREYPGLVSKWAFSDENIKAERRSAATFVASQEFRPQERLQTLVQALLAAVPGSNDVALASLDMLKDFGAVDTIQFVPEEQSKDSFVLDVIVLRQSRSNAEKLKSNLHELLTEIADGIEEEPSR